MQAPLYDYYKGYPIYDLGDCMFLTILESGHQARGHIDFITSFLDTWHDLKDFAPSYSEDDEEYPF